jgi:hypothetical protein
LCLLDFFEQHFHFDNKWRDALRYERHLVLETWKIQFYDEIQNFSASLGQCQTVSLGLKKIDTYGWMCGELASGHWQLTPDASILETNTVTWDENTI